MATDLERLVVSLEANIKKYERELNRSRGVTENALRDVERSVSASASRIEGRMAQVGASIRAGIAGALAGISLRNVAELADSFTKVQNSLKVTGLQGDRLTSTYNQLFDLAQKQGAPLETLAGLYSRTAQSQKELNATSGDLITFTNAVATALRAGGVGAVQADQALTQLGQALGSGKVQWEELESIVDSAPTILQAAAAGIKEADGSVGKLNALVKDGKVSSEALFRAIIAGLPAVQALSDRTQETTSQGFARLNNALIDFVGKLDEATGASKSATPSFRIGDRMTVSAALREAYASGDDEGIVIETLEVDHASLDGPIRLMRNVDGQLGEPGETMSLPIETGGPRLAHLLCAFELIAPGADSDGPTDGKIRMDNVSDLFHDLLKGAIGYDQAIRVTIRFYRVLPGRLDEVTGPDDDSFSGLEMTAVELSADSAEGTIAWPDGRQQNVPSGPDAFFDRANYPALFT